MAVFEGAVMVTDAPAQQSKLIIQYVRETCERKDIQALVREACKSGQDIKATVLLLNGSLPNIVRYCFSCRAMLLTGCR